MGVALAAGEPSDEWIDAFAAAKDEYFMNHYREILSGRGSKGSLGDEARRFVWRAFYEYGRAASKSPLSESAGAKCGGRRELHGFGVPGHECEDCNGTGRSPEGTPGGEGKP